jgi:hypothetical protein
VQKVSKLWQLWHLLSAVCIAGIHLNRNPQGEEEENPKLETKGTTKKTPTIPADMWWWLDESKWRRIIQVKTKLKREPICSTYPGTYSTTGFVAGGSHISYGTYVAEKNVQLIVY